MSSPECTYNRDRTLFIPISVSLPRAHVSAYSAGCFPATRCSPMYFPNVKYQRQRPSIVRVRFAAPTRTLPSKTSIFCSAASSSSTPPPEPVKPSSTSTTSASSKPSVSAEPNSTSHAEGSSADPDDKFTERVALARARARLLQAHLVARLVDAATQRAQNVLSTATTQENPSAASTARRLRRDVRTVRGVLDDSLSSDDSLFSSIGRLQGLIQELEQRADADLAFSRDRLQEDLEGGSTVQDDAGEAGDAGENNESRPAWQPAADFRRTVSGVSEVIEGRVAEFVRRDGSIDVEGLRGWARQLLDSIGTTWMRLNGRAPSPEGNGNVDIIRAAIAADALRDEEKEYRLREEIGVLEKQLFDSSKQRENALRREDQLSKLIRAKEIRMMDDNVSALRRTLAVRVLQLELEKIFVGIAQEINTVEYDLILDQRVLVVEFGDLDMRLGTLDVFVEQGEPQLIEDDTLGELAADIQDLKMRLGLDASLYSTATLSWDQMRQFLASSGKKARAGFDFYSRGLRLFVGDLRFAFRLIRRAITGYTPSAREVRTLRRTGRDLLTLIPFTIVLIAPLTPIGHVLIFSFLQRYWPEFFPSTFSERRQTMMKRREQYLDVLKDEGVTEDDNDDFNNEEDSGLWSSVRRFFFFTAPGKDLDSSKKPSQVTSNNRDGNGQVPNVTTENILEDEGRSVILSDLADAANDSDKKARKARIRVALDELHLAD